MRGLFVAARSVAALAIVAAVLVTLAGSVAAWRAQGLVDRPTLVTNFFSYFTIDSNLIAVAVLVAGAVLLGRRDQADPHWLTFARAAATVYMTITAIVYNLILRGESVSGGGVAQDWPNEVLHVVGPLWVLLDWILAPGRGRLRRRDIGWLLVFPGVWMAYTLIRGPWVYDQLDHAPTWYPYAFLDPGASGGGYTSVLTAVLVIAVAFALVATAVVAISRHAGRPRG